MCLDPGSIALIATATSALIGSYAQIKQGQAQYKASMYNAQIADRNKQAAINEQANVQDAAAIERRRLGMRVQQEKGAAIAAAAASGIDPNFGSPFDTQEGIQQTYLIDRSIIGRNEITALERLDKEVADYSDTAKMQRSGAKSALEAGYLGAAGSLLEGVSSVASSWIQPTAVTSTFTPAKPYYAKPISNSGPALLPVGG